MKHAKKWIVGSYEKERIPFYVQKLNISPTVAKLLLARGFSDLESTKSFLEKDSIYFHSTALFTDLQKAAVAIKKAIEDGKNIVIYGDYDVDGVTSVSALYLYLREHGASVSYHIPSRTGDGYGVNTQALQQLRDNGADLIITVDTGITAVTEAEFAKSIGLEMIVTDHHECQGTLPGALAVVNPKRKDCQYPFKELAGVGVVFKLLCALEIEYSGKDSNYLAKICKEYADLIAIGTVADVMPLRDENRLIVSLGLSILEKNPRIGIAALLEASGIFGNSQNDRKKNKRLTSTAISFALAPRINAAGRISNASKAVELFICEDPQKAVVLANELCMINRERQLEENIIAEEAYQMIEKDHDTTKEKVLVLAKDNWNNGIIGIVASRITEKYNLPSILISFDGDLGKGSGRSIKGMNLVDALLYCSDELMKFGGHELAAGLSIEKSQLPAFQKKINEYAKNCLENADTEPVLNIDCEIDVEEICLDLAYELLKLEPFGISNPVPLFTMRNVEITELIPIGNCKHTKLNIQKDKERLSAVFFGVTVSDLEACGFCAGSLADLAFNIDINEFQNQTSVQLTVRDIAHTAAYKDKRAQEEQLYHRIRESDVSTELSPYVPTREDFKTLYVYIRQQLKLGNDLFITDTMLRKFTFLSYVKMRLILDILEELVLIGVSSEGPGQFRIRLKNVSAKVSFEDSPLYRKLVSSLP